MIFPQNIIRFVVKSNFKPNSLPWSTFFLTLVFPLGSTQLQEKREGAQEPCLLLPFQTTSQQLSCMILITYSYYYSCCCNVCSDSTIRYLRSKYERKCDLLVPALFLLRPNNGRTKSSKKWKTILFFLENNLVIQSSRRRWGHRQRAIEKQFLFFVNFTFVCRSNGPQRLRIQILWMTPVQPTTSPSPEKSSKANIKWTIYTVITNKTKLRSTQWYFAMEGKRGKEKSGPDKLHWTCKCDALFINFSWIVSRIKEMKNDRKDAWDSERISHFRCE